MGGVFSFSCGVQRASLGLSFFRESPWVAILYMSTMEKLPSPVCFWGYVCQVQSLQITPFSGQALQKYLFLPGTDSGRVHNGDRKGTISGIGPLILKSYLFDS